MTKPSHAPIAVLVCAAVLLVPTLATAQQPASANLLRIVVIAGEDAINIIQQKTAVNPIVEVRDRNNLPVSGVAVTFSVGGGGGASFAGGASTLTVATNAAGQAVVTGLTPTTAGAVSINATAVVNGQTIAATITQTNFATAAEAASAASSAGGASGGGSGGAAGGGGGGIGGMSGTTLGIVGGGIAAAGALVATQAGGGGDAPATGTSGNTGTGTGTATTPTTPAPTTPAPGTSTSQTFNGPVSENVTFTWTSSFGSELIQTCNATYTRTGTLRLILTTQSGGTVTGTGQLLSVSTNTTSIRCADGTTIPLPDEASDSGDGGVVQVTGTTSNLRFQADLSLTDNSAGVAISIKGSTTFTGSLSGGVVTGTLADIYAFTSDSQGVSSRGNWSSSTQVTAR